MENRLLRRRGIPGTGIDVPYAAIGAMAFGARADEAEARRVVDAALDQGLNFFDVADSYQAGEAERILGRVLRGRRERCLIATKVGYGRRADGSEEGTSREAIFRAIDQSRANLGTDYVDIYYLHRPDPVVPVRESLSAMVELIAAGKIRAFAISNYGAWQSLELLQLCDTHGWPRPVMSQMLYNVLVRQIEYEYVRFCRRHGLHLTVYNPLAGGLLTGKYASLQDEQAGSRFVGNRMYRNRYWSARMFDAMLRLKAIAEEAGLPLTHLALAWIAQGQVVDSIILGPSREAQLRDCLAAGACELPAAVMARIGELLRELEGTDANYAR